MSVNKSIIKINIYFWAHKDSQDKISTSAKYLNIPQPSDLQGLPQSHFISQDTTRQCSIGGSDLLLQCASIHEADPFRLVWAQRASEIGIHYHWHLAASGATRGWDTSIAIQQNCTGGIGIMEGLDDSRGEVG